MALGIQTEATGDGDFEPFVKIDAKAGRMFKAERVQTADGWNKSMVEVRIPDESIFAADMENIRVGWLDFPTGQAPIRVTVMRGQPLPPKPTAGKARQGFELRVWGQRLGGWRMLSATARVVTQAFDAIDDRWLAAPERAQGLIPVLQITGVTPVTSTGSGQRSTNYAPVIQIVSWIPRPDGQPQLQAPAAPAPAVQTAQAGAPLAPAPAQPAYQSAMQPAAVPPGTFNTPPAPAPQPNGQFKPGAF